MGALILNLIADFQIKKENKQINKDINRFNKLIKEAVAADNDYMAKVDKLIDATSRKSTAQANFLWESVIILANRISDLEDQRNV